MEGYVGQRWDSSVEPPTVDNMLAHYHKFGLDNRTNTYNGKVVPYKSYKPFSKDAFVEVARAYLSEDAFVFLVGSIGYAHFDDAARKDWNKVREESE